MFFPMKTRSHRPTFLQARKHHVFPPFLPSCKRAARLGWPCVFTTRQVYLEEHVTLLLATLICRPHNCNAISRSPSGASGCTTRRDPRNRCLVPAYPNRLSHLMPLPPTWRKLVQRLRGRLLPSGRARDSSATPQHGCSANRP